MFKKSVLPSLVGHPFFRFPKLSKLSLSIGLHILVFKKNYSISNIKKPRIYISVKSVIPGYVEIPYVLDCIVSLRV